MSPHAVISGAGISGPALAHQLTARGWRTTILERHPALREEGQNVDVRGAAREVARRMGIDAEIRAANTGEIGMRFVTEDGTPVASFPIDGRDGVDGPTAELEILRGELSRILYEHTRDDTDYRFGAQLADVADHGDGVTAVLQDGTRLDADVVVIAEGLRSRSRRFVTPADVEEFGMYFAYLTIPRTEGDDAWWNWLHVPGSRSVHLRPDNLGGTRAILTFMSDVRGLERLARADQEMILARTFADVGGPAPRILAALADGAPGYFDAVGRVRTPHWSAGRVALLGDAASCNATFGGVGTSMGLIGAYVLAGELAAGDDHLAALARYEKVLRPGTAAMPTIEPSQLRRANPRTAGGIRALRAAARAAASPVGRRVASLAGRRMATLPVEGMRLPDYA